MDARSYLFVPGDRPERFAKALASGADAVVLDLEDAVAPERKALARDAVRAQLADGDPRLVVRINDESTAWFADDLTAARGAAAVLLAKAERAETLQRVREACPGTQVLALIETARGVLAAEALAQAAQRLVFGTIDFALDLDLSGDPIGLDYAASRLALASRAAGIAAPVAGVTAALDDDAALRADVARARAHGYTAKLCIHPRQVARVHELLAPSPAEIDWARRVIAASDASGGAAVQVDGRMVDKPILLRAQRLLARLP
ncbi:HpcH/HpaI aldolase/citrate lyase family protein [Piscinibacter defluvii]|uniref:HpcH/HpaI aldolase/citrate lyase family protein n=1 Tax=Piscinibacter defluvii TaxID=1796922 RepID=UPI000FDE4F18|nr:CoA ester lyase [Piscinibacter defluvii]